MGENHGLYNRAGRGTPDVSANAGPFQLIYKEQHIALYGTSFSAPVWASIITMINQERTNVGKGPVGFINPVLYANPGVLNDVVNGSNPGCGSEGFKAAEGWVSFLFFSFVFPPPPFFFCRRGNVISGGSSKMCERERLFWC